MGGQNHPGTRLIAYCTMEEKDLQRVSSDPWIKFLNGANHNYPESVLLEDLGNVRERMEEVFADTSSPDTRMSDDMNFTNPELIYLYNQVLEDMNSLDDEKEPCNICKLSLDKYTIITYFTAVFNLYKLLPYSNLYISIFSVKMSRFSYSLYN